MLLRAHTLATYRRAPDSVADGRQNVQQPQGLLWSALACFRLRKSTENIDQNVGAVRLSGKVARQDTCDQSLGRRIKFRKADWFRNVVSFHARTIHLCFSVAGSIDCLRTVPR